jgi:hypothetical protein
LVAFDGECCGDKHSVGGWGSWFKNAERVLGLSAFAGFLVT